MSLPKLLPAALLLSLTASGCALEDPDMYDEASGAYGGKADYGNHEISITETTFLKKRIESASQLDWGSEKCTLMGGTTYVSRRAPTREGSYYLIDVVTTIPGCEFSLGYVLASTVGDVEVSEDDDPVSSGGGPCHADISVRKCALLSTIAYAEGTGDDYNVIFSFKRFSSYADHPRRRYCSGRLCSDAAGRYQFLSSTWDWVRPKIGASSFSPANQDRGALWLISYRGVGNIDSINTYTEFKRAIYRLNREWASLPGSPYGQPTHSMSSLWRVYRAHAGL